MNKKPKLELTWIGKKNRPKLEPRILLEDLPALRYARQAGPPCCFTRRQRRTYVGNRINRRIKTMFDNPTPARKKDGSKPAGRLSLNRMFQ